MAKINICDVHCVQDVGKLSDPFVFNITFECFEALQEDIEWKLVYVSSAYKEDLDQTLDSILVGPIPVGKHQFILETPPPDFSKIPKDDIVGVTVVLIQAFYRNKEFIRVGYYVNNEYKDENLKTEPPSQPILDKLERQIISSNPRVTRFPIDWGDGLLDGCPEPEQDIESSPQSKRQKFDKEDDMANQEVVDEDEDEEEDDDESEESDENAEHDVECSDDEEDEEDADDSEDEIEDEAQDKNENINPKLSEESSETSKSVKELQPAIDSKEPLNEVSKN